MESFDLIRFAAALIFVLALIGACALGLRYFGFAPRLPITRQGAGPRLAVLESLFIDPRRRLLLIRRDGVEHLILLGVQSETLIEGHITKTPIAPEAPFEDLHQRIVNGLRAEPHL
ncbi:MAG TPA: hypothetical protein DCL54_08075 [Alphaproteobacteria bacterium]|nr:hypothetical protein [Alphaproteobacteria bacterium]HAJ46522.1 hypothetical protein [Alphaproteobacteria bacterium]